MLCDVLVIDDDPDERETVCETLRSFGLTAASAPDGVAALSLLRTAPASAVVLDLLMPEKDGWTVLWEMRADPRLRDLPIIVMSALSGQEFLREAGVSDYLIKPFDPRDLVVAVRRALGRSQEPAGPTGDA